MFCFTLKDSITTFWDKAGRSCIGGKFVNRRAIAGSLTFPSGLVLFIEDGGSAFRPSADCGTFGAAYLTGCEVDAYDY